MRALWLSHWLYIVLCCNNWHTGDSICKNTIPIINYLSDSSTSVNKIRFTSQSKKNIEIRNYYKWNCKKAHQTSIAGYLLKQANWRIIILIPSQSVCLLFLLNAACLAEKLQILIFIVFWFDLTGARTHYLPHWRRVC